MTETEGYTDSHGDYIPGPDDFEGEIDLFEIKVLCLYEEDADKLLNWLHVVGTKEKIEGFELYFQGEEAEFDDAAVAIDEREAQDN